VIITATTFTYAALILMTTILIILRYSVAYAFNGLIGIKILTRFRVASSRIRILDRCRRVYVDYIIEYMHCEDHSMSC
jgi:hypothetical protein